jgi:hypothetical protein
MSKPVLKRYQKKHGRQPECYRCHKLILVGDRYCFSGSRTNVYCSDCFVLIYIDVEDRCEADLKELSGL